MMKKKTKTLSLGSKVIKCVQDKYSFDTYEEAVVMKRKLEQSYKYISLGCIYQLSEKEYVIYAVRKDKSN